MTLTTGGRAAARIRPVSIVEAISDDLRDAILGGQLRPGDALTEAEVSREYNVARPTAKAAIEALVHNGLLARTQHKTARVVELGPDDVRDIYRSREVIESQVLRMLAMNRVVLDEARLANDEIAQLPEASALAVVGPDMRFHTAIVDALGSERISRMYRSLAAEVTLCMTRVQGDNLLPTWLITGEHQRILELVEAGDGEAAVALLHEHLGRARERLVGVVGGTPGEEAHLEAQWRRSS